MKYDIKFLFLLLLLVNIGCTSTFYSPDSSRLTPLKKEKEVLATGGLSASEIGRTFTGDLGYSPKKNFGTQLFFKYNNSQKTLGAGIGTYHSKIKYNDDGKIKLFSVFDIYGAYSYNQGRAMTYNVLNTRDFNYIFVDFSLQAGVHFFNKNVGIDLAIRPHIVDVISVDVYGEVDRTEFEVLGEDPFYYYDYLGRIYFGKRNRFLYLGGTVSVGPEKLNIFNDPISFSIGLVVNFKEIFKNNI